jgi:choice-of-anchor C domain-containing protein
MHRSTQLLVGLLLVFGVARADAGLIVNGSFEQGTYTVPGFQRLFNGDTSLTGWSVGGVGVDWHVATPNPGLNPALINPHFGPAQNGSLVIDLNLDGGISGTGTISQSFATTVGQAYVLSFYMAGDAFFANPQQVQVTVAGLSQVITQPTSPQYQKVWGLKTLEFIAIAPTTTLSFASPNGSGFWGPLLDNVDVNPVPEPTSLALLGSGLIGLCGYRLRRRQQI